MNSIDIRRNLWGYNMEKELRIDILTAVERAKEVFRRSCLRDCTTQEDLDLYESEYKTHPYGCYTAVVNKLKSDIKEKKIGRRLTYNELCTYIETQHKRLLLHGVLWRLQHMRADTSTASKFYDRYTSTGE